jgi:hypothetical protein
VRTPEYRIPIKCHTSVDVVITRDDSVNGGFIADGDVALVVPQVVQVKA